MKTVRFLLVYFLFLGVVEAAEPKIPNYDEWKLCRVQSASTKVCFDDFPAIAGNMAVEYADAKGVPVLLMLITFARNASTGKADMVTARFYQNIDGKWNNLGMREFARSQSPARTFIMFFDAGSSFGKAYIALMHSHGYEAIQVPSFRFD